MDTGNIALGALTLGQLIAERPFSWGLGILGILVWLVLFTVAALLIESRERRM